MTKTHLALRDNLSGKYTILSLKAISMGVMKATRNMTIMGRKKYILIYNQFYFTPKSVKGIIPQLYEI